MRVGRRALLRGALGIAISALATWVLVTSVDVGRTLDTLRTAAPAAIAVMLGLVAIDLGFRAARWRGLLAPIAPLPYRRVLGYTLVGYLANNVLPARLGELFRSHALGEGEGISRPTVLGTVVVERIVDTVTVVVIASLAVVAVSAAGELSGAVLLGGAFAATLVVGLAVLMTAHRLPGAARLARRADRWPRVRDLATRLRAGLAVAGRPRIVGRAAVVGLAAWVASITTFLVAGAAVGVELSVAQAALLCTGVALVTIVPAGPGYVGTFELTAVAIARTFGVADDRAFALALLVHAAIFGVTSAGGVVAFVRLGIGARRMSSGEAAPA